MFEITMIHDQENLTRLLFGPFLVLLLFDKVGWETARNGEAPSAASPKQWTHPQPKLKVKVGVEAFMISSCRQHQLFERYHKQIQPILHNLTLFEEVTWKLNITPPYPDRNRNIVVRPITFSRVTSFVQLCTAMAILCIFVRFSLPLIDW